MILRCIIVTGMKLNKNCPYFQENHYSHSYWYSVIQILFFLFAIYKRILFNYLLFIVSSEEESMNYEETEKSQELIDEEIEHVSNEEDSTKLSDVSSGDNDGESTSGNVHLILS